MFSVVRDHWPPDFSMSCEGNKTTRHTGPVIKESIHDLHEPAWWTGVRVSTPRPTDLEATVVLASLDNPSFEPMKWTQRFGELCPFPYPIPAKMAAALKLYVTVTCEQHAGPSIICLPFHEMPHLKSRDNYVFVNTDGSLVMAWDGNKWCKSGMDHQPKWRTIHIVVPRLSSVLDKTNTLPTMACIHDWEEKTR